MCSDLRLILLLYPQPMTYPSLGHRILVPILTDNNNLHNSSSKIFRKVNSNSLRRSNYWPENTKVNAFHQHSVSQRVRTHSSSDASTITHSSCLLKSLKISMFNLWARLKVLRMPLPHHQRSMWLLSQVPFHQLLVVMNGAISARVSTQLAKR
jgi:hypothetical protein